MYYKVPIVNGELDIDYKYLIKGHTISGTESIVELYDDALKRDSWISATQSDWDNATAPTLDEVKTSKKVALQQSYYASFITFQSSATGVLKTYPIDTEAQDNLRDLQNRLIADPNKDSFYFKTIEDGTLINHTRAQFLQLMQDAETFKVQQTQHYDGKIKDVDNATDEATVNAITW